MNRRLPLGSPAAGADSGTTSPAAVSPPARRLIAVMLVAAAALDLTRCGLVVVAVRHPASAAGLVMIGLAAAALSVRTARGYQGGQRWAVWAALLTGAASAPQAAVPGFSTPYTIPDTATAVLGVVLAVAVLATIGRTEEKLVKAFPAECRGGPDCRISQVVEGPIHSCPCRLCATS
jgi:hypothetical protein